MSNGLPDTLDAFLDERLPLFSTPPDADWSEGVADIYETTTAVVQTAVARWFATTTIRPSTRPRGFDAVLDALRSAGHRLTPHRDSRSRTSFRTPAKGSSMRTRSRPSASTCRPTRRHR